MAQMASQRLPINGRSKFHENQFSISLESIRMKRPRYPRVKRNGENGDESQTYCYIDLLLNSP